MSGEDFVRETLRGSAGQPDYCCFTAHAESEGRLHQGLLESILAGCGRPVLPLGEAPRSELPRLEMRMGRVPGRPSDVCIQQ